MKVFRFQTQLFNALWTLWKRQTDHLQLLCRTLFFNYFTSWSTIIDTGLEPLFWFVDNFVRYLGPIFMVIIAGIVMSVVVTFYVCLLPHKWHQSTGWSIYHLVVGHWFLANTAFHYYKAAFTDPGTPPQQIPEVVSICKKCISPKPPRTHHCSICDRCVLKMDHHCPWLNNCVGHYNHRHFFQFCVFMCIGCFYVSYCAYEVYKEHYYGRNDTEFVGLFSWKWFKRLYYMLADDPPADYVGTELLQYGGIVSPYEEVGGFHAHQWVGYMFMLSTAASAAVGLLTLFHGRLINSAQTSIEIHINRKERKRLKDKGLVFRNPYDFGAWKNWKIFLGLHNGRSFWRHIFLPSGHPPEGNGLQWKTNSYTDPNGLLLL